MASTNRVLPQPVGPFNTTAIPWLLLAKVSTTAGPDGDRFAGTTYIQRIATVGGLPPAASECTVAGTKVEVPYTADYVFYKSQLA